MFIPGAVAGILANNSWWTKKILSSSRMDLKLRIFKLVVGLAYRSINKWLWCRNRTVLIKSTTAGENLLVLLPLHSITETYFFFAAMCCVQKCGCFDELKKSTSPNLCSYRSFVVVAGSMLRLQHSADPQTHQVMKSMQQQEAFRRVASWPSNQS